MVRSFVTVNAILQFKNIYKCYLSPYLLCDFYH